MLKKHIKFFKNKERIQRFNDLEIENFNQENILVITYFSRKVQIDDGKKVLVDVVV